MIEDLQMTVDSQDKRIAALEAKLDLMTGDFARVIAEHVVREINGVA
jgi:hypothetical protein